MIPPGEKGDLEVQDIKKEVEMKKKSGVSYKEIMKNSILDKFIEKEDQKTEDSKD